ncbi:MAG: hypothetical protein GF329_03985 [Candidatus Lokiarchaeota archaeon]|nr:hypothetical protein [Candidatus Lokiarchaeota archaeon]
MNLKTQEIFVPVIYTGTVAKLIQNLGIEKTIEKLEQLGRNMGDTILKIWKPESRDIEKIIKESYKQILLKEPNIETQSDGKIYIVRDEDCILCWNVEAEIHYCIPIGKMLEKIINYCSEIHSNIPRVNVETTKSKAKGFDFCEHIINLGD